MPSSLRYLSVCSGIEAASVAWHPLGWTPVAFSEIEPFPSAVLAHRFPDVPNLGDMTAHAAWPLRSGDIDLLVGGTPCQSFSVAGLRRGLSDPRGGLMLTYLEIARSLRPRWIVWENVPGVLSSGRGRDFGSFLGALGELGYGWAYRVLDAQWVRTQRHPRAVPQRRRRVFVVGCLGDWRAAAEVLFERESVRRDPASRAASRQGSAADAQGCAGTVSSKWAKGTGGPAGDECYNLTMDHDYSRADRFTMIAQQLSGTLGTRGLRSHTELDGHGAYIPVAYRKSKRAQSATDDESWIEAEQANTLNQFDTGERDTHAVAVNISNGEPRISDCMGTLDAARESRDSNQQRFLLQALSVAQNQLGEVRCSEIAGTVNTNSNATGRNTQIAAIAFSCKDHGADSGEISPTMRAMQHDGSHENGGGQIAVAFHPTQDPISSADGSTHCMGTGSGQGNATVAVAHAMTVRRLTPRECERLQGFPDDWTLIPWRKRDAIDCPDGPRYKALGNSMAVNCMEWIGERIAAKETRR